MTQRNMAKLLKFNEKEVEKMGVCQSEIKLVDETLDQYVLRWDLQQTVIPRKRLKKVILGAATSREFSTLSRKPNLLLGMTVNTKMLQGVMKILR